MTLKFWHSICKKDLVAKNHEFTLSFMNNAVCSFRSFMICCKPSIRISSVRYNVKFEESEVFDSCQPQCRLPQCISNKLKELYTSCFVFMGWKWLFYPSVTARNASSNKKRCWKLKRQVILNQVYLALPVALLYPSLNLTTKTYRRTTLSAVCYGCVRLHTACPVTHYMYYRSAGWIAAWSVGRDLTGNGDSFETVVEWCFEYTVPGAPDSRFIYTASSLGVAQYSALIG
jgi:hypothetical protein